MTPILKSLNSEEIRGASNCFWKQLGYIFGERKGNLKGAANKGGRRNWNKLQDRLARMVINVCKSVCILWDMFIILI